MSGRLGVFDRLVWGGWVIQGLFLAYSLGRSPLHFGFATAICMVVWLAMAVYAIEKRLYPMLRLHPFWLCAMMLSVALVGLYPGAPIAPEVSVWLPLHSAFGLASYTLFAMAVFHAWQWGRKESDLRLHHAALKQAPAAAPKTLGKAQQTDARLGRSAMPLLTLERLMFHFVALGFVLLSITLVLGLGFREYLYGPHHIWRWEHKIVFAILAWLVFACLLFLRWRRGWRGWAAVRMVYAGAGVLLLSYVGSRFVIEVLLHR